MLESKIQSKIIKFLESRGFYAVKANASKRGFPDVIAVRRSKTLFFEIKTNNRKPTVLQSLTLERLNSADRVAFVVRSVDEVHDILTIIDI